MERFIFRTSEKIRLDDFLRKKLPEAAGGGEFTNGKIRRLILAGSVKVNEIQTKRPAFELRGNSTVHVEFDRQKFFYERQPDDVPFIMTQNDILFEDENLIFVNKPAFIPVEQTVTGNRANLHDILVDFLWRRNPELRNPPYSGIMHRLDRETSGVILFTKNRRINAAVHSMFENHEFEKIYTAVCAPVSGSSFFPGQKFYVENSIGRTSPKSRTSTWGPLPEKSGGLYARTDFEIYGECDVGGRRCLLVRCRPLTGRTHQIRVHLSGKGLPIAGDTLYGGPEFSCGTEITVKTEEGTRKSKLERNRVLLHAERLTAHTETLEFDVRAPLPW